MGHLGKMLFWACIFASTQLITSVASNPCTSHPCQNGGECYDEGRTFFCDCKEGFFGNRCENSKQSHCQPHPCMNEATCYEEGRTFFCDCKEGFSGTRCEK